MSPETATIIDTGDENFRLWSVAETLRRAGCARIVKTLEPRSIGSRILAAFQPVSGAGTGGVPRLESEGCRPWDRHSATNTMKETCHHADQHEKLNSPETQ